MNAFIIYHDGEYQKTYQLLVALIPAHLSLPWSKGARSDSVRQLLVQGARVLQIWVEPRHFKAFSHVSVEFFHMSPLLKYMFSTSCLRICVTYGHYFLWLKGDSVWSLLWTFAHLYLPFLWLWIFLLQEASSSPWKWITPTPCAFLYSVLSFAIVWRGSLTFLCFPAKFFDSAHYIFQILVLTYVRDQ